MHILRILFLLHATLHNLTNHSRVTLNMGIMELNNSMQPFEKFNLIFKQWMPPSPVILYIVTEYVVSVELREKLLPYTELAGRIHKEASALRLGCNGRQRVNRLEGLFHRLALSALVEDRTSPLSLIWPPRPCSSCFCVTHSHNVTALSDNTQAIRFNNMVGNSRFDSFSVK